MVSETTTKLASFYGRASDCTLSGEKRSSSPTVEVRYGHDYSRLADYYPRPADNRWRDLGPRRFVELEADGNSTETLGYGDCNDLRRVWHARYCPGLTPVAHSGRSRCGGSLELRRIDRFNELSALRHKVRREHRCADRLAGCSLRSPLTEQPSVIDVAYWPFASFTPPQCFGRDWGHRKGISPQSSWRRFWISRG